MASTHTVRVLCMEDDPGLARLTKACLERAGYEVDLAGDGAEGLALYAAGAYDVLTVDQDMPAKEGLQVIRELGSAGELPPTIMVTGTGNEQLAVQAMKLGAGDYVVKDAHGGYLELLPTVIEKLLHRQQLIREREQALEALEQSEARYRALFEHMPVGLYRTTVDGRFLDVNPALVSMLRYPDRETLLSTHVAQLYWKPQQRESWKSRMERGDIVGDELQLCRYDGNPIWVRDIARAARDQAGAIQWFEGSITDISERKAAAAELKRYSEQLEEMVDERTKELRAAQEQLVRREQLAVLGQLAGGLSHELRNPLGVIANAAQVLELILDEADDTVREFLDMITSEVHRAEKIIYDLLDFSKTRVAAPQAADVAKLVVRVIERCPPPDGVTVEHHVPPGMPKALVDERQIDQVLTNLIINGYEAMGEGGKLTVTAGVDDGQVVLAVTDTGSGMGRDELAQLFEPLFTTKHHGIGLGLSVVRMLVERNGGSIDVQSAVGQGTTFTLRLPQGDTRPTAANSALSAAGARGDTLALPAQRPAANGDVGPAPPQAGPVTHSAGA